MQLSSYFPFLFLLLCLLGFVYSAGQSRPKFEPLTGIIDDCCCSVQTVDDSLYNEHMHSMLNDLVSTTFFRYFKVNYLKGCPFWDDHSMCSIDGPGECGICECDKNEIPQAWNVKPTNKDSITNWKEKDEDVWIFQDDTKETMYVNLITNPERYTGYGGGNSVNIWQMIYKENCFPDPYECTEERVFYRLISGLHASTTAHICENYLQDNVWSPNLDMFMYRLGAFPDRLKNIYFTFVYLLRAAKKASDFLSTYDYYTAHPEEDQRVQGLVRSLLSSSLVCSNTFDETTLFQGERASLKREFMTKFRNISSIMDCVSCQTCKVHAKLQILGIATATKILLASDPNIIQNLQHNEISSLINTLFKFSESIQIIHNMKGREDEYLKKLAEKSEQSQSTNSPSTKDQTTKDQTTKDQTKKAETSKDHTTKDQTKKDSTKDQTTKDQTTKDPTAKDPTAKDPTTKDQSTKDHTTKDHTTKDHHTKGHFTTQHNHTHSSVYALIAAVVLVTVAILYSSRNTLSKKKLSNTKSTHSTGKKPEEKTNPLRKSSDKIKSNHTTQNTSGKDQKQS